MEERRQYPRCPATLRAEFEIEGSTETLQAEVRDLSACGVGLHSERRMAPFTTLSHFRLELEDGEGAYTLDATAVVVRSELLKLDDGSETYFSGVQFLDLEPATVERVRRFVLDRLLDGD